MNMMTLTKTFIDVAIRAAEGLASDAAVGIPIPEMDGYFIIQHGRKSNGDTIIATIESEDGQNQYDIYVPHKAHQEA